MNNGKKVFDPAKYKNTTREQWEAAAEPWHRWGSLLTSWLGPATETMFDMADIGEGSHVLDVAAGAGDQTVQAATRVGPSGRVLATDLSPTILDFAKQRAVAEGHHHVETRELDGERLHTLEECTFDAVISRVGMIYFPDQQKALAGMKHTLKDSGKVAAMVYSTADRNGFFSIPVSIIRRRAELPPPLPGQPGPFSLGGEGVLVEAFEKAGFRNIESRVIDAPLKVKSATECLAFEQESFGALHQMLGGLSEQEKSEAWDEIETELRRLRRSLRTRCCSGYQVARQDRDACGRIEVIKAYDRKTSSTKANHGTANRCSQEHRSYPHYGFG
jgi:SAM-dependent methyltransferase